MISTLKKKIYANLSNKKQIENLKELNSHISISKIILELLKISLVIAAKINIEMNIVLVVFINL